MSRRVIERIVKKNGGGKIILVVLDGLGGLPHPGTGKTELETAVTPHLDHLARRSSLGMHDPVGTGITPGSGPGHLSLFGYNPVEYQIGRGVLSALGVGIDLQPGDVAARLNLATFDSEGLVVDRRAGRPVDAVARQVLERVRDGIKLSIGIELELVHEKEHRAVLVLRGQGQPGLGSDLGDTDPQQAGRADLPVRALKPGSERTAQIVTQFLTQAREVLADETGANGFLARGFAGFERYPTLQDRFGVRSAVTAKYPMYRGVARLVGMDVLGEPEDNVSTVDLLEEHHENHDFCFLHFKDPDSRGHDADFDGKVEAIEAIDALMPRITALDPAVLIVTGDHSTPALYGEHSWHDVPLLLSSQWARPTAETFGETTCRAGDVGRIPGWEILPLALAHAQRLEKFGA